LIATWPTAALAVFLIVVLAVIVLDARLLHD
jgi:hypothetical protein